MAPSFTSFVLNNAHRDDVIGKVGQAMKAYMADHPDIKRSATMAFWKRELPDFAPWTWPLLAECHMCSKHPGRRFGAPLGIGSDPLGDVPLAVMKKLMHDPVPINADEYIVYRLYSYKAKKHYTGITKKGQLRHRLDQHNGERNIRGGAKATAGYSDWRVRWAIARPQRLTLGDALKVEHFVKAFCERVPGAGDRDVIEKGIPEGFAGTDLADGWVVAKEADRLPSKLRI